MREITETALLYLALSHPNAWIEETEGTRLLKIPMYDFDTDKAWVEERLIVPGPVETPMGILPIFNVRTGATFTPGGDAKISPLGKLYRIIGYSPPKDDA